MLSFNHIQEAIEDLHAASVKITTQTVMAAEAAARDNCPVASGFLQSTIYHVTKAESNYGQRAGDPPGDAYMLDPIDPPTSDQEAILSAAANYAEFVEDGTRYAAAQPFLTPAADQAESIMLDLWQHLESYLKSY